MMEIVKLKFKLTKLSIVVMTLKPFDEENSPVKERNQTSPAKDLADRFADFFQDKISNISAGFSDIRFSCCFS